MLRIIVHKKKVYFSKDIICELDENRYIDYKIRENHLSLFLNPVASKKSQLLKGFCCKVLNKE
ncbi:hypothetical protein K5E_22240 [Enterococcus thailandicus]|nr:hypothetical protein K4E_00690 [Enterococcus thailandicus]GMC10085.1 hypothetical protein K5E_22240 [Enterococcus thailandicus]